MLRCRLLHIGRCISHSVPGELSDLDVPEPIESPADEAYRSPAAAQEDPAGLIALVAADVLACETSITMPAATQAPDAASLTEATQSQETERVILAVVAKTVSTPENIDDASSIDEPDHCEATIHARSDHEPYMHISTFRLRVLKVGAKVARHARYIPIHACSTALHAWQRFLNHFKQFHWHSLVSTPHTASPIHGRGTFAPGTGVFLWHDCTEKWVQRARKPGLRAQ